MGQHRFDKLEVMSIIDDQTVFKVPRVDADGAVLVKDAEGNDPQLVFPNHQRVLFIDHEAAEAQEDMLNPAHASYIPEYAEGLDWSPVGTHIPNDVAKEFGLVQGSKLGATFALSCRTRKGNFDVKRQQVRPAVQEYKGISKIKIKKVVAKASAPAVPTRVQIAANSDW